MAGTTNGGKEGNLGVGGGEGGTEEEDEASGKLNHKGVRSKF